MKYFQMMLTRLHKATRLHPVISLKFVGVFILILSCKTLKTDNDTYVVINTVLDTYVEKDSIYLYPKMALLNNKKKEELKAYGIDINNCNTTIKTVISNNEEEVVTAIGEEKWNANKIASPKVFTRLELKKPESIARYEKIAETVKDEDGLLARKFMLWSIEHNERMVRLSRPLFNKDRTHALVYSSKHSDGEFVFLLKKETRKKWKIVCEKRVSHY